MTTEPPAAMTTEPSAAGTLVLRRWRVEDAAALREAVDESLDSLKLWMSWAHEEPSPLHVLEARLRAYADDFAANRRWRYAVWLGPTGPLVGGASLHPRVGPGALEVSYWVRSGWRVEVADATERGPACVTPSRQQ